MTPGDESVIDFAASRRDFDRDTRRGFFGGRVTYTTADQKAFYAYGLHMPDFNDSDAPRLAPVGATNFDYEATYFGVGASGSFSPALLYMGEFVYQIGQSQSDPLLGLQTSEDIRAFAARGMLTYLLGGELNARLELEALFASGDDDRRVSTDTVGGNLSGTDDTAFNSLGFVNTGLAGFSAPDGSNQRPIEGAWSGDVFARRENSSVSSGSSTTRPAGMRRGVESSLRAVAAAKRKIETLRASHFMRSKEHSVSRYAP